MFQATLLVDRYYTPFLCFFGGIGNSLSLLVFCADTQYRSQSSSWYLASLAISDTLYLFNLFLLWLAGFTSKSVLTSGEFSCPLIMYIGQVACFLSVYLILAFSVERYLAVHFPLSQLNSCRVSKAKKVIASLTGLSLLLFSYVWLIAKVVPLPLHVQPNEGDESGDNNQTIYQNLTLVHRCSVPEEYYTISEVAGYMDTLITFVAPFLIISFANVRIAMLLWKRKAHTEIEVSTTSSLSQLPRSVTMEMNEDNIQCRTFSTMSTATSILDSINQSGQPVQQREQQNNSQIQKERESISSGTAYNRECGVSRRHDTSAAEVRVTKTLLLVSSTFLLLNLPLHAIRSVQFVFSVSTESYEMHQEVLDTAHIWANMLFNTNFSVNFLLYCASGKKFRNSFGKIIRKICWGR